MPDQATQQDARSRLQQLFKDAPLENHSRVWDGLWTKGDFLPWDRGQPSPALLDALKAKSDIIGAPFYVTEDGSFLRKKALVPGCGAGYDVLLFASFGYDSFGLEVSESATNAARKFANANPRKFVEEEPEFGAGASSFIHSDFFSKEDNWRGRAGLAKDAQFDLIYDYTFFCAIPPEKRPRWAERMSEMLAADGKLICLEFPTYKSPGTGGPPFGVKPHVYVAHLSNPGIDVPYDSAGEPEPNTFSDEAISSTKNELALKRIAHWQPERTHPVGQGTDWMSVWTHK